MIVNVSFSMFCDSFNRSDRKDNFSYNGKRALFDHLEQVEEETGEQIELDIIALCCDFSEYGTATEAAKNYFKFEGMTFDEEGNELETVEEVEEKALEFLKDNTIVLEFNSGIIIQNF